ncbi:zinc-binding protein A33-like [Acanthochromis polyacanthus]|uniref:zinc-binding protein A33-like n=1 Tax=Acanthochromis polyacanthus TaxID=80966 RepID=UPI0022349179|nr:zinc-binding protein A33-like [Acanthochromis polyacanthus]
MVSVQCSEDLTCSVCLSIFMDPVTLSCGHSFCRQCVTDVHSCPQCRAALSTEAKCLPTTGVLKSLAEKVREAEKMKEEGGSEKAEVPDLCPEHEEKLKLFCVTEQQLTCIICRDGEKHEGHKFKPIKEAAASQRKELETFVQDVIDDIHAIESLANTQREEMTKSKETSEQLMTQIGRQFEEMHQFLQRREDEIKNELKHKEEDGIEKMSHSLKSIETALSERKEMEVKATSILEISDSEKFLKSWTEDKSMMTTEDLFRPRANELQVVNTSLSLGPYESHLQFFMWKEMLQVIQPRAEWLSLKRDSTVLSVSDDGRRLFSVPQSNQADLFSKFGQPAFGVLTGHNTTPSPVVLGSSSYQVKARDMGLFAAPPLTFAKQSENLSSFPSSRTNYACSVTEFTSGQHYWEVEVGSRNYWELGLKDDILLYDGLMYHTLHHNVGLPLAFEGRPRKIGVYLNCSSKKLSFYDADNMKHIHTLCPDLTSMPVSAYFNIRRKEPDHNPITVCWY